jgi:hypothetical protein
MVVMNICNGYKMWIPAFAGMTTQPYSAFVGMTMQPYSAFVGMTMQPYSASPNTRELEMVKLKEQVNSLLTEMGKPALY